MIYLQARQPKPALVDFEAAIRLRPDDIDAYLARARLLLAQPDVDPKAVADTKSDLDAVSRLAAPPAYVHLELGGMYGRLGDYSDAVGQIDQWLNTHPLEGDQLTGLNSRCYLRAWTNQDLTEALDDCNRALKRAWDDADYLNSRGLVYLRLHRPKDAVRDYDKALRINPTLADSLYGRGLAKLRLGEKAQGQNDLAAAEKLDRGVVKFFTTMGLSP